MIPQDYVDLSIKKLAESGHATVKQIVDYCIANSDRLDPGDEIRIEKIVKNTLEPLCYYGHLSRCGEKYKVEGNILNVRGLVFDDVPEMKSITKSALKALDEMDKNTSYGKDPTINDVRDFTVG